MDNKERFDRIKKENKEWMKREVEEIISLYTSKTAYIFIDEINWNDGYNENSYDFKFMEQDLSRHFAYPRLDKEETDRVIEHFNDLLPYRFTKTQKDGTMRTIMTRNPCTVGDHLTDLGSIGIWHSAIVHRVDSEGEKQEKGGLLLHMGYVFTNTKKERETDLNVVYFYSYCKTVAK